jgi:hypothetical protein
MSFFFGPALRDETLDPKKDQKRSRQKYASLRTGRARARIFVGPAHSQD